MQKFTVPQRFFLHFYIVGSLFNGLLLLVLLVYIPIKPSFIGDNKMSSEEAWRTFLLLFLFELQVLRRLYEDMFVTKFSSSARMHILAYLCGIV
jgi:3-oxo-5-alpha-steroid 4-dehydrogenase 3